MGDGVSKNAVEKLIDARERIAELEAALKEVRSLSAFEKNQPTGLHMTCLSKIEKTATLALAGCDTYDFETQD